MGAGGTNVGFFTYSLMADNVADVGQNESATALIGNISASHYVGGGTYSPNALETARDMLQSSGRPGVKQVVVFLTDGPGALDEGLAYNMSLDMQQDGIEMFAISEYSTRSPCRTS